MKKCGGVPLAAKVFGGLLRFELGEKQWLNVRDSRIWERPQTHGNTILPVLKWSYIHLAPHLRQCDLIRLWIANGFIQSKGERQMEDIGDENCLVDRSFKMNGKVQLVLWFIVRCMTLYMISHAPLT